MKSRISLCFRTSCHAGTLLTKLWIRSGIYLEMKSLLQGVVQQPCTTTAGRQGIASNLPRAEQRSPCLTHGMAAESEAQAAQPHKLASGCEGGHHPAQLTLELFEEVQRRPFYPAPSEGINLCASYSVEEAWWHLWWGSGYGIVTEEEHKKTSKSEK